MQYEIISFGELSSEQLEQWEKLQHSNPSLWSPYFNLEFIELVAHVRNDVKIIVVSKQSASIGFLPCQINTSRIVRPVAGALSDNHGIICAQDTNITISKMLSELRLKRFEYNHFLGSQKSFLLNTFMSDVSPIIDLSRGFEYYLSDLKKKKSKLESKIRKAYRRLEQDSCTIEFNLFSTDKKDLEFVIKTKQQQFLNTLGIDPFQHDWIRGLFNKLFEIKKDNFEGVLSTFKINGQLAAAHFGMKNNKVWHWWFPVYDRSFQQYTPGLLILFEMAKKISELDVAYIDLGKDKVQYKRMFSNNHIVLLEGIEVNQDEIIQSVYSALASWYINNPDNISSRVINKIVRFNNKGNRFL